MRSPEDLVQIKVSLYSIISLDMERIEMDPAWIEVCQRVDLEDPEQVKQALFQYLGLYISREELFDNRFMPATNGPANVIITDMELIDG